MDGSALLTMSSGWGPLQIDHHPRRAEDRSSLIRPATAGLKTLKCDQERLRSLTTEHAAVTLQHAYMVEDFSSIAVYHLALRYSPRAVVNTAAEGKEVCLFCHRPTGVFITDGWRKTLLRVTCTLR